MPLRLLADECILDKLLIEKLREAGHDVLTATDAGLIANSDETVFDKAISENRLILTLNCIDFVELATSRISQNKSHPGVLLVYKNNVPSKDMTNAQITNAIANLEKSGLKLRNACHKLNDYNY